MISFAIDVETVSRSVNDALVSDRLLCDLGNGVAPGVRRTETHKECAKWLRCELGLRLLGAEISKEPTEFELSVHTGFFRTTGK